MKIRIPAALVLMIALGGSVRAADPLETAKQQYLSAAYEEALATLSTLPKDVNADEADKFRALCLLALNRRDEAAKALEGLALRRPLLTFDETESPKFVLLFREARIRVLAPAARSMYGEAKGSFDKGELEKARTQFSDLRALLAEPELAKQPEASDLKQLAEGFAKLVDQELVRQAAAAAPPPAPAASPVFTPIAAPARAGAGNPTAGSGTGTATAGTAARPSPPPTTPPARTPAAQATPASTTRTPGAGEPAIYTADDASVVAPVPVDQRLPPWVPPANLVNESFSGLIEVLIDETGKVTSAVMSKSLNATYDRLLLSAARRWQYRPALLNGRPVKFRRFVSVVLSPTGR